MDEIILSTIKTPLDIEEDDTSFDKDIVMHINTIFSVLTQLGVGPVKGFRISAAGGEKWSDFLPNDEQRLEMVKDYIFLKCKLIFDPPTSGALLQTIKETIAELEWRISVAVDPVNT